MAAAGGSAALQHNLLLQYKSIGALRRFSRISCGAQMCNICSAFYYNPFLKLSQLLFAFFVKIYILFLSFPIAE